MRQSLFQGAAAILTLRTGILNKKPNCVADFKAPFLILGMIKSEWSSMHYTGNLQERVGTRISTTDAEEQLTSLLPSHFGLF